MLILSRKAGEKIVINDNIEIEIVDVSGDKVKIGISAPKDVKVLRSELKQTIENNIKASAAVSPDAFKNMLDSVKKK